MVCFTGMLLVSRCMAGSIRAHQVLNPIYIFHNKTPLYPHTHTTHCLVALHLFADLHVDLEELGNAAVEADRLAPVQLCLAIVGRNTLFGARLREPTREDQRGRPQKPDRPSSPIEHIRDELKLRLRRCDLLGR